MKNLIAIIFAITLVGLATDAKAQKATDVTVDEVEFKKGDIEFSLGVGLLPTFTSNNAKARILPISFMANYRIKQFLSIGGYAAFSSTNGYENRQNNDEIPETDPVLRNDFYIFGIRTEGHFNRERMDFYGGAMVSYNYSKITTQLEPGDKMPEDIIIDEKDNGGFKYSGYVGLKYMMTKHIGAFGEIGYGASIINLGVTTKF